MRRRSALGVIGSAVAAMASKLSFGLIARPSRAIVSLREKYIRAIALVMQIENRQDGFFPTVASAHVSAEGSMDGKVTVSRVRKRPYLYCDENYTSLDTPPYESTAQARESLEYEIDEFRKVSISTVLGLGHHDRQLAREILAIAFGTIISRDVYHHINSIHARRFYRTESSPRDTDDVTTFATQVRGIGAAELGDGSASTMLQEIIREINDIKPSFVLSELRQLPPQELFPHILPFDSPVDPKCPVLAGVKFPVSDRQLDRFHGHGKYQHISESRIDTGYLCPKTGKFVDGDSKGTLHHGWLWEPEREPEFCTDGVTVTVTDDGDGFAVDVSTSLWFNKESLQNVIAFAVPKV